MCFCPPLALSPVAGSSSFGDSGRALRWVLESAPFLSHHFTSTKASPWAHSLLYLVTREGGVFSLASYWDPQISL